MAGHNERLMKATARDVERAVVRVASSFIVDVHRGTVKRYGPSPGTPVDTGRARSGGNASINKPGNWNPPKEAAAHPIVNEPEIEANLARGKIGDKFIWYSRVPYAARLEYDGHSKQAPDGFLRKSVQHAQQRAERFKP